MKVGGNPGMNEEYSNDRSVLLEKLEALVPLLSHREVDPPVPASGVAFHERRLIAILLSTRLSSLSDRWTFWFCNNSGNNQCDRKHLLDWLHNLIRSTWKSEGSRYTTESCKSDISWIYIRLGTHVLWSLTNDVDQMNAYQAVTLSMALRPLVETLVKTVWGNPKVDDQNAHRIDVELACALDGYLQLFCTPCNTGSYDENEILLPLLQRCILAAQIVRMNPKVSDGAADVHGTDEASQLAARQIMIQTLTRALDQTGLLNETIDSTPNPNWDMLLLEVGLRTITNSAIRRHNRFSLALCSQMLLGFIELRNASLKPPVSGTSLIHDSRKKIAMAILVTLNATFAMRNGTEEVQKDFVENPELSQRLTQLIMLCVVSTEASNTLRSLAWTTVDSLLDSMGCEWMITSPTTLQPGNHPGNTRKSRSDSEAKLGHSNPFLTLVRLSVGEWKIQLGRIISSIDDQTEGTGPKLEWNFDQEVLDILRACSKIIDHALQFATTMSNRVDDINDDNHDSGRRLSSDAVLHLQRSLEEAFDAALQYLLAVDPSFKKTDTCSFTNTIDGVNSWVLRVLGVLLTEFDVFECSRRNSSLRHNAGQTYPHICDDEHETGNVFLRAMHIGIMLSLRNSQGGVPKLDRDAAQLSLVYGLCSILASSEGDQIRINLLNEYDLLGGNVVSLLVQVYTELNDVDAIVWACQAVELWWSAFRLLPVQDDELVQQLLKAMVECLRARVLPQSQQPSDKVARAALQVVSTYAMLYGDNPPGEPDASILEKALALQSNV